MYPDSFPYAWIISLAGLAEPDACRKLMERRVSHIGFDGDIVIVLRLPEAV